jgi:hypothetical protein
MRRGRKRSAAEAAEDGRVAAVVEGTVDAAAVGADVAAVVVGAVVTVVAIVAETGEIAGIAGKRVWFKEFVKQIREGIEASPESFFFLFLILRSFHSPVIFTTDCWSCILPFCQRARSFLPSTGE